MLANPDSLDAATLVEMASRLRSQQIQGVLRVEGERLAMRDILQRTHGPNGRLNATGWAVLQRFRGGGPSGNGWRARMERLAGPLRLLFAASHEGELAAHDAHLDAWDARLRLPARDAAGPPPGTPAGWDRPRFVLRHTVLASVAASLGHLPHQQELALARHDAARLAVALARFRLAHGDWPAALDELVPAFLDARPADRITGGPLRYAVRGDRPAVWSVGADRDDDGGVPAANGPTAAALWGNDAASSPDGDWILLGAAG